MATAFGALLVCVYLICSLFPSSLNWGVHILSFLPVPLRFGIPLLMFSALFPAVQDAIASTIERSAIRVRQLQFPAGKMIVAACAVGAALMFWFFREKTFLLGDGRLALRNLGEVNGVESIPVGFKNSPVPALLLWKVSQLLQRVHVDQAPQAAFQVVSVATGVLFFLFVLMLIRRLSSDPTDRVLGTLFVVAGGGTQLFFGYVEAYPPTYCVLALFTWLAVACLDGKVHLLFPSAAFGLLLACHFGMVFMAPAMLFLLVQEIRRGRVVACLVSTVVLSGTLVVLLWMSGYTVDLLAGVFLKESGTHVVPLAGPPSGWHGYSLFSLWHLLDLANLYALLAPFAVVILLLRAGVVSGRLGSGRGHWLFFGLLALGGLAFSLLMNFDIGMSRDWDLLAPYVLAVVLASAFFWMGSVESVIMRRRLMVMMVVITALNTAAYVLVNAQEESSLARFATLPDDRLWGSSARAYAYEDLSAYYRDRREIVPASQYTEKCLQADSTNSRRWVNASVVFQMSGDKGREIQAYERAVQLGTQVAWVYGNLGSEYINEGRPQEASWLLRRALELDPDLPMAAYNLGSLLGSTMKRHEEALPYLLRAVQTDSTYPLAWLNTGTCLYEMGRYEEMIPFYQRFLQLSPADPAAPAIRQLLASVRRKN